jgi:hypothetical protein
VIRSGELRILVLGGSHRAISGALVADRPRVTALNRGMRPVAGVEQLAADDRVLRRERHERLGYPSDSPCRAHRARHARSGGRCDRRAPARRDRARAILDANRNLHAARDQARLRRVFQARGIAPLV